MMGQVFRGSGDCVPLAETLPCVTVPCALIAEQAVLHEGLGARHGHLLRVKLQLVSVLPSTTTLLCGLFGS